MAQKTKDARIGTPTPTGFGWTQTKKFNYRRQSKGHSLVLFTDFKNPAVWGYGVDACWSVDRFAHWWEAEDAALAEIERCLAYEREL